jgi:hypothetical protein
VADAVLVTEMFGQVDAGWSFHLSSKSWNRNPDGVRRFFNCGQLAIRK